MIFKAELIEKVLAREKTVTRRPAKLEDGGYGGGFFLPCRYKVCRHYALQGPPEKGSKARAKTIEGYRLRILRVNLEALGDIDGPESRLEGFKTRTGFQEYWRNLYGRFDSTQLVHRIEFELLPLDHYREGVGMSDSDTLQYMGTDAMKWAEKFSGMADAADDEVMITWFANAICAGEDAQRAKDEKTTIETPGLLSSVLAARSEAWDELHWCWFPDHSVGETGGEA